MSMTTVKLARCGLLALVLGCSSRAPHRETPTNRSSDAPADAAVYTLPVDVTTLIARWEECWHWSGEEPYDAARKQQIADGVAHSCPGNTEERERLRARYRDRADILDALKKLDEMQ